MVSVPLLPGRFCGTGIQLLEIRVTCIDCGSVGNRRLQAFPRQRALISTSAVTEFLDNLLDWLAQYLFVVVQDYCFDIGSAAVAQSEITPVEYLSVLVVSREMFVDQRREFSANVVGYCCVVWRIKPSDVAFAVSLGFWFGFSELQLINETAV